MVTITTSTQSDEEIRQAFKANGFEVAEPEVNAEEGAETSEQPGTPETPAAAPAGEIVPPSEAGEKKPLETPAAGTEEETGKSRGHFKSKIVKQEARIARLADDLEVERGNKEKLRQELEAAQAQLAALKPAQAAEDEVPVRPKRPTMKDAEYQEEKLEELLAQYDNDLEQYQVKLTAKAVNDAIKQREETEQNQRAQALAEEEHAKFVGRLNADRESIADYRDYLDAMPDEIQLPPVVEDAIRSADHPGLLFYHLMKDAVDNDSTELNRILKLNPLLQVREITKLEARLVAESEKQPAKPAAAEEKKPAPAKAAEAEAEKPPVKQKPAPAAKLDTDDPIDPLGNRGAGGTARLGQAKGALDYMRLRAAGVSRA